MEQYTKGEWIAVNGRILCKTQFSGVADIAQLIARDTRESELANARLISASPDLYEACKQALTFFTEYDIENKVISGLSLQLNEAIAKVEGG